MSGKIVARILKGFQQISQKGTAYALREAVYSFYFHRYERLRRRLEKEGHPKSHLCSLWGEEFELHPSLKGISEELLLLGVHEPIATQAYSEHLLLGDHVIDVGSNIGYFLFLARDVVGNSGRILGFEPAPDVYRVLQRNIRRMRQNQDNIQIFPWALSAKNETTYFYESEIPNWGSLVRTTNLLQKGKTPVKARRLDDVLQEVPDFRPTVLRMDVEGGELMVLAGARETLRVHKPLLFIEFHSFALGWDAIRDAFVELRNIGYRGGVFIDRIWDNPWIGKWIRNRRCWQGNIDDFLTRINSSNGLPRVFSVILEASDTRRTFTFDQ